MGKIWKYFIVLNDPKCELSNIVQNKGYSGNGLPLCQDFSIAINFDSPEQLLTWVKSNTQLSIENEDFHIEGHYIENPMN